MAKNKLTDFSLPAHSYTAFDALSLKGLIKDRLNRTTKFTGQNFEGSNMSALIDVMAYSYHVLLFYLNQTSSESMFTEAELYENMNRIVKSLDYKPVGAQSPNLSFTAKASTSINIGTYTIPRYTFIDVSGVPYSIKEDITFTKTIAGLETLTDLSNNNLLYQGKFSEYPLYSAIGEDFETLTLVPGDGIILDHFNIHVYVKDVDTSKWSEWRRTTSLFLERTNSKTYEVRLNENKRYELKFGDNITGGRLKRGDQVAVYYLESNGKNGEVGVEAINQSTILRYNTRQFVEIFNEIKDPNINYVSDAEVNHLTLSNTNASSEFYEGETVEQIRERAPKIFSTQHRLVTKEDYETYIAQNYSNVIKDVRVVNNWDYIDGHLKYNIETLGLDRANNDPRTLFNQVTFADSCDFNNVYVYAVPRAEQTTSAIVRNNYLSPAQKNLIIRGVRGPKTLTTETVIMDPVYVAVDFGTYQSDTEDLSLEHSDNTQFRVVRNPNSTRSADSIKSAVHGIFTNAFKAATLGQTISVTEIVKDILTVDGVQEIFTVRTDINHKQDGLSFFVWNPIYPNDDIVSTGSNLILPHFKYPYINDPVGFANKIVVVTESSSSGLAEY